VIAVRIVSWNIENASSTVLAALPQVVAQWGTPDVVCLQELRVRHHDAEAVGRFIRALPGYRCHYSLARDAHNVKFRGGRMYGVATFVRGRWEGEVPAWDLEGRIVVVRKPGLAIANVYAVNGTAKPYYDAQGCVAGDRHTLKRRFQGHVMDLGRDLRRAGGVIMAGDWNVSRTAQDTHPRLRTEEPHARARAELNARMAAEGFVDIWRARHPEQRAYTWFNRRARGLDAARVDYVLVSEDLVAAVRSADILDLLPWSDHAPVRVTLASAAGRRRKPAERASGA
jgi:exodeoxyribonuclease III